MTKIQRKRLLKLINFLDTLPPEKFDFSFVIREAENKGHVCGTVCCAIGWTPKLFPRLVEWYFKEDDAVCLIRIKKDKTAYGYHVIAEHLFGIPRKLAWVLFAPFGTSSDFAARRLTPLEPLGADASPSDVANQLRRYLDIFHPLTA